MKYKHVIWDWNGTLLNDVELGHSLLIRLQELKGIESSSFEEYKKIFTFPIIKFYKNAGIYEGEEDFKELAKVYINNYKKGVLDCKLQPGAKEALNILKDNGITSSVLTASHEEMALEQIAHYGLNGCFAAVTGKTDYYASGKSELIQVHLDKIGYNSSEIVFVGDTLHDAEIADIIGCGHILVENGHQYIDGNMKKDLETAQNLMKVIDIILNR
jgi:phosphoglycolate phosphatase